MHEWKWLLLIHLTFADTPAPEDSTNPVEEDSNVKETDDKIPEIESTYL